MKIANCEHLDNLEVCLPKNETLRNQKKYDNAAVYFFIHFYWKAFKYL